MEEGDKMNFVIGSNGRIGKKLVSTHSFKNITTIDRSIYDKWYSYGALDKISKYFESWAGTGDTIYIVAGVLDPLESEELHELVNFVLPKNIINGTLKHGLKVVTFGTIMDQFVDDKSTNPYFKSKKKLSTFIDQYHNKNYLLNIKLHTLFGGGPPNKHMFLGEVLHSISTNTLFKMTSGNQLREYHFIDDEIRAIKKLIDLNVSGQINLSHGDPIYLKDLAKHIFHELGCPQLLSIGSINETRSDNFNIVFNRPAELQDINFRDSELAVVKYLKTYLKMKH